MCETMPMSSFSTSSFELFEELPVVVKDEIIRRVSPAVLINLARTCTRNYQLCKRIRKYPFKEIILDFSEKPDVTLATEGAENKQFEVVLVNYLDERINFAPKNWAKKRITVVDKITLINDTSELTESQVSLITETINQILPAIVEEIGEIEIQGLFPVNAVKRIFAACKNLETFKLAGTRLSESTSADDLFESVQTITRIDINNVESNISFNDSIFKLLRAKTSPQHPIQAITIHEFFSTAAIVDFTTEYHLFAPFSSVEFIVDKACQWNYLQHLNSELKHVKQATPVLAENVPKIGINGHHIN